MSVYIEDRQTLSGRQRLTTFDFLSLRRRWRLVGACVAVSVALGLCFVALRPASYTAATQLLIYVKEVQPGPDLVISLGRADLTQVENESEIIRSRGTLAKVARSLNLTDDPEFAPATTPLQRIAQWLSPPWFSGEPRAMSVEGSSRRDSAQDAAEGLAREAATDLAVESLARQVTVKRVGTSHTVLVNVTTSDPDKSARIANAIGQTLIQGRVGAEQGGDRSPLLRERLQGLGPSAYVITQALAPDRPDGPRKILVMLGALMAGSLIGSGLALLLDFRDGTIRTARQVEHLGLECIGAIPLLTSRQAAASRRTQPRPEHVGNDHAGDGAFLPDRLQEQTLLRATVAIEAAEARIVGIASPTAGEGATTVARDLARSAARSQRKVLLVEREAHPGPAQLSDPQSQPCGGNIRSSAGNGPDVLAAAAPGDQDGAEDWRAHCGRASLAAYDLIIVSLPPLECGAEFRRAARNIDGILLVMKWGGAEIDQVERAFAVSGAAPSDFIGAVLNMVDDRMIGQFGDKFWKSEAFTAARRSLFSPAMPTHHVTRPS